MHHPILIFGANGQVGKALAALLGNQALTFTRQQADFSKADQLYSLLKTLDFTPRAILNAAAYTAVDKAETEEDLALLANADSPAILAEYCKTKIIPFVHYSTDYVFSGQGDAPWKEDDLPAPQNAYGRTKRQGEEYITAIGGDYRIFRTSWVYDARGRNFLNTMLRLGNERESLSVVNDQHGAPTYAPHLAQATLESLSHTAPGLYHLCNSGTTTWHGFAEAIFKASTGLKVKHVEGIPSSAYPTPAKRPLNSRLDCSKAERSFGIRLPHWEAGLRHALQEKTA